MTNLDNALDLQADADALHKDLFDALAALETAIAMMAQCIGQFSRNPAFMATRETFHRLAADHDMPGVG
jgi:hypothetical protein